MNKWKSIKTIAYRMTIMMQDSIYDKHKVMPMLSHLRDHKVKEVSKRFYETSDQFKTLNDNKYKMDGQMSAWIKDKTVHLILCNSYIQKMNILIQMKWEDNFSEKDQEEHIADFK